MTSKFKAKKVHRNGLTFDSKAEYDRWCQLRLLEKAGIISELQRQVKYSLLPAQKIGGKTVERAASYIADFVYQRDGETVVEDVKGVKTPEYVLKRKLMLYLHGIRIREVCAYGSD